ncbi:MAG: hypothetical protein IPO19_08050 [Rhodoferax sp.]|nr:hypothetical protein [Rhodoferax sp.]
MLSNVSDEHPNRSPALPRPELAQAYLQGFDLGLTSARGLFARRRMGKSEFLKHDLLPAARKAGYLAAYTNLWDDTEHPARRWPRRFCWRSSPRAWAASGRNSTPPSVSCKGGAKLPLGSDASMELDLAAPRRRPRCPRSRPRCKPADKANKRLLLVIDEAQVPAAPQHKAVAHYCAQG